MESVKKYAGNWNLSVEVLLKRLEAAGVMGKTADDILSDEDKKTLTAKTTIGSKKLSLKRTTTTTLSQSRSGVSKTKGVIVEERKKKIFANKPHYMSTKPADLDDQKHKKRQEFDALRKVEDQKLAKLELARKQTIDDKRQFEKTQAEQKLSKEQDETVAVVATPAVVEPEKTNKKPPKQKKSVDYKNPRRAKLHVKSGSAKRRKPVVIKDNSKKVTVSTEHGFTKPTKPVILEVNIPETITVGNLAQKLSIKAADLLKVMMNNGIMATINQTIDQDTAYLLVEEMGHKPIAVTDTTLEDKILQETNDNSDADAKPRPPVVTIMGHVDHGKTSLLDYIRNSQVTKGEAGGITQHIGAYKVNTKNGEITFLDTPGHAAFTAMRARGAKVTDIVIIVVGADDGVMPQTVEAIEHAKAAHVPIIVAMNKMDKEEADPEKIKNEMSKYELIPEDWGGEVSFVPVSAHTGLGVDALLEAVLLNAEILELNAPYDTRAKGSIVESRIDKGRGPVATVIIQSGTLNKGDIVLSGREFGKIRGMSNDKGESINQATPSTAIEILGLSGAPEAGSDMIVVEKERQARELADERISKYRNIKLAQHKQSNLDKMFSQMEDGKLSEVNILVKSDVHGSSEAIRESLVKLSNDEVKVNVVSAGVGGINESDANLALASNAIIIGFNVRSDASAKKIINQENLDIHYFSIIYDLIDQVKKLVLGEMKPVFKETITGLAEVRDVFRAPKIGAIAGCMVTEGFVKRNNNLRVLRDNVVIFEGELESLRRFKDDAKEVQSGTECGIGIKDYNDVQIGDQIEVFGLIEIARKL